MKKHLLLLTLPMMLASCNQKVDTSSLTIISPSGAPCLALYNYAITGQLTTNSNAPSVGAQLLNDQYDVVVFDFLNGLKRLKTNNGHYKLARILTGGNLYLIGINKDSEHANPNEGDYVVSFGDANSLPNVALRKIYNESVNNIDYVSAVSDIAPILKTGKKSGVDVDYVVIAEPLLTTVMSTLDPNNYTKVSLREKWGEKFATTPFIPQAGMFFNMNSYEEKKSMYNQFLDDIDDDIDLAIDNPLEVKSIMEQIGDEEKQKETFSFTANQVYNVQKDQKNGFALVGSDDEFSLQDFFTKAEIIEDYSAFIL